MNYDLSRLMDNLRIRLPGALDTVLKLELFSALNDFFQNSNCWYEDVDFQVTAGVTAYTVTPSSVAATVRLLGLVNSAEQSVAAVLALPDTLTLVNAPSKTDTFTARIALTVDDPVTRDEFPNFPGWVLNKYNNDIQNGVLGRMMTQIAKPYTNERMAIYHTRAFRNAIAFAKVEAMHQNVYRGQNWKFPQTFARRHAR